MPPRLDTSRAALLGSLAIIAVVALWALVLPFINSLVEGANPFKADEPFDLGGGASIVPVDGWSLDPAGNEGIFTIMDKGAAVLTVVAATDSTEAIGDALQTAADGLADDPSTHWEIGEATTFNTGAGAPGGSITAHSPSDVSSTWIIDDGVRNVTAIGTSSETTWSQFGPEMETMIRSVDLDATPDVEATEAP